MIAGRDGMGLLGSEGGGKNRNETPAKRLSAAGTHRGANEEFKEFVTQGIYC